jgi:copper oxidase (laccase) domain-containing protein
MPNPEPEGAHVWFFTRHGGVSQPPFDSLNISRKVGYDPDAVAENLVRRRGAMDRHPFTWTSQVAGEGVLRGSAGPGLLGRPTRYKRLREGSSWWPPLLVASPWR